MGRRNRRYTTKKGWIFDELRAATLTGQLEPGQRLLENELAERYDASATPVREAMRQLEAEGLVLSEPHRCVRVIETGVQETRERYLICMGLEKLALELAMENIEEIPIDELQLMLDEIQELRDRERWSDLRLLHFDFHNARHKCERTNAAAILEPTLGTSALRSNRNNSRTRARSA